MALLSSIVIKSNYHSDLRRFTWNTSTSFGHLLQTLSHLYGKAVDKLVVKYVDDEGDMVKIASTEEFQEAVRLASLNSPPILRIQLEDGNSPMLILPQGVASSWAIIPNEVSDSRIFTSPPNTTTNTSTGSSITGRIQAFQLPTWGKRTSPTSSSNNATSPNSSIVGSPTNTQPSCFPGTSPPNTTNNNNNNNNIQTSDFIGHAQLADFVQQLFPNALQNITPIASTTTTTTNTTASPSAFAVSQPIPIKTSETVRESVMQVSEQTQIDLLQTSCSVRDLISESSDKQYLTSLAQSPPASSTSAFDLHCREIGSSVRADCMLQSDDISQKLTAGRSRTLSSSTANVPGDNWADNVIASAVAQKTTLEADCKSISDALYARLRAV